ncbi:hypothetical protein GGI23_007123, partial [Coemansia sp. RSA 2559]
HVKGISIRLKLIDGSWVDEAVDPQEPRCWTQPDDLCPLEALVGERDVLVRVQPVFIVQRKQRLKAADKELAVELFELCSNQGQHLFHRHFCEVGSMADIVLVDELVDGGRWQRVCDVEAAAKEQREFAGLERGADHDPADLCEARIRAFGAVGAVSHRGVQSIHVVWPL